MTCELATYNRDDGSYLRKDLQVDFRRVHVTETDDLAALEEDDEGNLSIKEEPKRSLFYTDRLFSKHGGKLHDFPRGRARGRGGWPRRGRGGRGGQRAPAGVHEQQENREYEEYITVPAPRGTDRAQRRQQAVNQLQIANLIRTLRPKVKTKVFKPIRCPPNPLSSLPSLLDHLRPGEGCGRNHQGQGGQERREEQGQARADREGGQDEGEAPDRALLLEGHKEEEEVEAWPVARGLSAAHFINKSFEKPLCDIKIKNCHEPKQRFSRIVSTADKLPSITTSRRPNGHAVTLFTENGLLLRSNSWGSKNNWYNFTHSPLRPLNSIQGKQRRRIIRTSPKGTPFPSRENPRRAHARFKTGGSSLRNPLKTSEEDPELFFKATI